MTKFSKTLVVISFVLSVAFAAFGGSLLVGGINWQSEAKSIEGYSFERKESEGQPTTWDVKEHISNETIAGATPHLAKAVIAARNDLQDRQNTEIKALTDKSSKLETRIAETKEFFPIDKDAVVNSDEFLTKELLTTTKSSENISKELVRLSKQTQAVRQELKKRREDVYRLEHQVKVIKTDQTRIIEQIQQTKIQVSALNAQIGSLKQRILQLNKQLKK